MANLLTEEQVLLNQQILERFVETYSSLNLQKVLTTLNDTFTVPEKRIERIEAFIRDAGQKLNFSTGEALIVGAETLMPKNPQFLWRGAMPLHDLTLFPAPGGLGKTTITWGLAARVSNGRMHEFGLSDLTGPGKVLIFCGEDDWETMVAPTLICNHAIMSNVKLTARKLDGKPFTFADHDVFEKAIAEVRPDLVIIDNANKFSNKQTDSFRSESVYQDTGMLQNLCKKYQTTAMLLHHTPKQKDDQKKNQSKDPVVYGSTGWIDSVRSVLQMRRGPEPELERIIWQSKSNNVVRLKPTLFRQELVSVPGYDEKYYRVHCVGDYSREETVDEPVKVLSKQQKFNLLGIELLNENNCKMPLEELKACIGEDPEFGLEEAQIMRVMIARFKKVDDVWFDETTKTIGIGKTPLDVSKITITANTLL